MSLGTRDQQCIGDTTEGDIALRFLTDCESRNVRATCFMTGRFVVDESACARSIAALSGIEVGGHTWSAFQPEIVHRVFKKILGSFNGPRWYQRRDIQRTIEAVTRELGLTPTSWRNHAYINDANTLELLCNEGIRILSDGTSDTAVEPELTPSGMYVFPINCIPDHEHLLHGKRTREYVDKWIKRTGFKDSFTSESYTFEDWFEIFERHLRAHESSNEISVVLIHPICIWLAGGDRALHRTISLIAEYPTCTLSETLSLKPEYKRATS